MVNVFTLYAGIIIKFITWGNDKKKIQHWFWESRLFIPTKLPEMCGFSSIPRVRMQIPCVILRRGEQSEPLFIDRGRCRPAGLTWHADRDLLAAPCPSVHPGVFVLFHHSVSF